MGHALTISDGLYHRLEKLAQERGLQTVEQLLEATFLAEVEERQRQATVRQIDALRQTLFERYGEMADSVDLIRADRDR
jgi:hypothetical protein